MTVAGIGLWFALLVDRFAKPMNDLAGSPVSIPCNEGEGP